ncbi:MAG: NifU family protein [bacterium]|jgi:Fe-S cluster biogenesis protein NfuA|nr:NifU family protein [bacterium]
MLDRGKVETVLKEKVEPFLAMHGGGVELVDVTEEGMVKVRLQGACAGCMGAQMTLKGVVENILTQEIEEVKGVEASF